MSYKRIHNLNVFTLILNVFFSFKCPLNFLNKTVSLAWIALLNQDFDEVFAREIFGLQNRDKLNDDLK